MLVGSFCISDSVWDYCLAFGRCFVFWIVLWGLLRIGGSALFSVRLEGLLFSSVSSEMVHIFSASVRGGV